MRQEKKIHYRQLYGRMEEMQIKERSDNFQIEWARRGYVVVSFDLYGHGESEVLNDTEWFDNGRGLYDTVQYVATLSLCGCR